LPPPLLDRRALNRALLARQFLLERQPIPAIDAIHHLVGLQAQAPAPPYVALWTRLAEFEADDVSQLMLARAVVRLALMRSTIYLVTAADALVVRPLVQPAFDRTLQPILRQQLADVDPDELLAAGRALVEERPLTWDDLGRTLAERWPGRPPSLLARVIRDQLPLVQVPPRGVWGRSGPAAHTTAEQWLGQPVTAEPSLADLVLRYLAAYGPATVRDVQAWSGLTGLGAVLERLRPRLLTFRDDDGRELFDLPEAPRPDSESPAPLRFLAEFDVALLSHQDRARIMTDEQRRSVFTANGIVQGTVLVDGFVAGIWKLDRQRAGTTLAIESFAPLTAGVEAGLIEEGAGLLRFAAAEAAAHDVRFSTRP
jgi:hypothetical protein